MCNVCCNFRSNCELFFISISTQFYSGSFPPNLSLFLLLPPLRFDVNHSLFHNFTFHRSTWISHWIQTIIRILVLSDSHLHQKHWTITSRNWMDAMGSLLKVSKCSFRFELNCFHSLILVWV